MNCDGPEPGFGRNAGFVVTVDALPIVAVPEPEPIDAYSSVTNASGWMGRGGGCGGGKSSGKVAGNVPAFGRAKPGGTLVRS